MESSQRAYEVLTRNSNPLSALSYNSAFSALKEHEIGNLLCGFTSRFF
jgi:hypothetical protein